MAIQTINATIQMRRGLERDFNANKMTAGEWAVSLDNKYVRMCFAPGVVVRMATYDAFEADMAEIQTILATCRDIQTAVDAMAELAGQHKNAAAQSAQSAAESATVAGESESAAVAAKDAAVLAKNEAKASETAAKTSEDNALAYKNDASASAQSALESKNAAAASEQAALLAKQTAETSIQVSTQKASDASASATAAESYARGGTGTRDGEGMDNAKYYCEQSHGYVEQVRDVAQTAINNVNDAVNFARPEFLTDPDSGHLYYSGGRFDFAVDNNGHLRWAVAL